jgi:hypothetical protein
MVPGLSMKLTSQDEEIEMRIVGDKFAVSLLKRIEVVGHKVGIC